MSGTVQIGKKRYKISYIQKVLDDRGLVDDVVDQSYKEAVADLAVEKIKQQYRRVVLVISFIFLVAVPPATFFAFFVPVIQTEVSAQIGFATAGYRETTVEFLSGLAEEQLELQRKKNDPKKDIEEAEKLQKVFNQKIDEANESIVEANDLLERSKFLEDQLTELQHRIRFGLEQ